MTELARLMYIVLHTRQSLLGIKNAGVIYATFQSILPWNIALRPRLQLPSFLLFFSLHNRSLWEWFSVDSKGFYFGRLTLSSAEQRNTLIYLYFCCCCCWCCCCEVCACVLLLLTLLLMIMLLCCCCVLAGDYFGRKLVMITILRIKKSCGEKCDKSVKNESTYISRCQGIISVIN